MITRVHLSHYMMDLPCIKTFTRGQWRALSSKEKKKYVTFRKLKDYII